MVEGGAEFPETGGERGSDDESTYATYGTTHPTNDTTNTNNDATDLLSTVPTTPPTLIAALRATIRHGWRNSGRCSASLGIGTRREQYYTNLPTPT
jgi:hypothetical protein